MSGQTEVTVGQPVYLEAQLYDEESSLPLVVKALIYKTDGSLASTITLAHTEKGIFVDESYLMPDEPVLYVKYYVFAANGTTSKTDDYGIIGEKFVKRLSGTVSVLTVIGEPIKGELIIPPIIEGEIIDICEELEGIIPEPTSLEGEIIVISPLIGEVVNE